MMNTGNPPFRPPAEMNPIEILQQLIGVFASKGWLNQTLRIKHRDRRYRVVCSETKFFAYRINDCCGVPPGLPGWPVCLVSGDQIIEDADMGAFASTEPSVGEWLRCIADDDFEWI